MKFSAGDWVRVVKKSGIASNVGKLQIAKHDEDGWYYATTISGQAMYVHWSELQFTSAPAKLKNVTLVVKDKGGCGNDS